MKDYSRTKKILLTASRLILMIAFLYFFICSLSFLSDSFRILGGKNVGNLFENSELLKNPVVGLMLGVLVTVLLQSSSTSTSIIVGLVSAGTAKVQYAIPMIMGANIGTSVTNTIVSFTQVGNREEFKRAFACATVHDMFNWLTVILLLLLEVIFSPLEKITGAIVENNNRSNDTGVSNPDFLKALTSPFTKKIIKLDKKILKSWGLGDGKYVNATSLLKTHCKDDDKNVLEVCPYLFAHLGPEGQNIADVYIGLILLVISLCMLTGCLIGMVKCLNALLGEEVKGFIEKVINRDIPIKGLGWLTGYIFIVLGAVITILVQSSSVFTSTLTPLAGAGLISLERAYPMTLGSNIGTTTTSLLASLADADSSHFKEALQIALVHLFFNIFGILIFFPIPAMRWPIPMANTLGRVTAQFRWFSLVYLVCMFLVFPLIIFGLSLGGPILMYVVLIPVAATILLCVLVVLVQKKKPEILPGFLRRRKLSSVFIGFLQSIDNIFSKIAFCKRKGESSDLDKGGKNSVPMDNFAFQADEKV
eukprot:TRINITY_DN3357_c0_g1_i10.p1 TRINITY_DN3357_c0_g1~~TRINITY_DN3357_c0_g1_i10.p1  ORF type:complete len:534 (+),score=66.21 TRINITY_DN3357_c0_g1_i10:73-1674(+)